MQFAIIIFFIFKILNWHWEIHLQTEYALMMLHVALTDYSGDLELLCSLNKWHCIRESTACIVLRTSCDFQVILIHWGHL